MEGLQLDGGGGVKSSRTSDEHRAEISVIQQRIMATMVHTEPVPERSLEERLTYDLRTHNASLQPAIFSDATLMQRVVADVDDMDVALAVELDNEVDVESLNLMDPFNFD